MAVVLHHICCWPRYDYAVAVIVYTACGPQYDSEGPALCLLTQLRFKLALCCGATLHMVSGPVAVTACGPQYSTEGLALCPLVQFEGSPALFVLSTGPAAAACGRAACAFSWW